MPLFNRRKKFKPSAQDLADMEQVTHTMARLKAEMPKGIFEAHQHSINHKVEIEKSKLCGCFYCLHTFQPTEIIEWIVSVNDEFAMCPKCGIDSVIGDASGYPVTDEFLREMNQHWFGGDAPVIEPSK